MNNLVFSSAVMTLSQTTEFMRNKSIDNIIIHLIVLQKFKNFTVKEAFDGIHSELPVRLEQVEKSLDRSYKNKILQIDEGSVDEFRKAKLKISDAVKDKLDAQYYHLNGYTEQAIEELFQGLVNDNNKEIYKNLFLETVSNLMAKYGYAYAGQLAGIADATEFIPSKELAQVCQNSIKKYKVSISSKDLSNSIGYLFDRRDPCLNNLAFCICNRYYQTRLIGLDLPIDFLTENLYKDSTIFLDTNFIGNIAFTKSKRHNEFREILKNAGKLGIRFAASELTIAEIHARVQDYMPELEAGEELLPVELIEEIRDEIIQQSHGKTEKIEFDLSSSENAKRLIEMGVDIIKFKENGDLFNKEELNIAIEELRSFDRKYRSQYEAKDERALYHDAYHYFLVRNERELKGKTGAWFLSMDHSVIEHSIYTKDIISPPYAIRLLSILQTLSQFVESQALKGEFSELFGELIAKDLLPRDQVFSYDDLKLLIGFDIKAKEIPPEFVRKATNHIKINILKGGGITDENRAEVIHEFTKYLSTPDQNFLEIQQKYDKKIRDRDDDINLKDGEIKEYVKIVKDKNEKIDLLSNRLTALEDSLIKEKYKSAFDKYESQKIDFKDEEISKYLKSLSKIRNGYLWFLSIAIVIFSGWYFIEDIALLFNKTIEINRYIKYGLAFFIFALPFVRSLFDHKKVINSFLIWNKKYKSEVIKRKEKDFENIYKSEFKEPELINFTNTKAQNTN